MKILRLIIPFLLIASAGFGQVNIQQPSSTGYLDNSVPRRNGTANKMEGTTVLITDANLVLAPGFTSSAADPADSGLLRMANAELIAWEASPAGTDGTLTFNSSEQFVFSNTILSPDVTTSITTPSTNFTAFAGATTLMTIGGTGASASSFFPSTLDTTSSVTGAIRTSGGISAAKALNIGTTGTFGGVVTAASFTGTGTTPGAMSLAAGTGSISALPADSAGFAAPASGGTAYLIKFPATITAGIPKFATPASGDGVNESAMTVVAAPTGAIVGTSDIQTLTNKWVQARVTSISSSATPTYDTDSCDVVNITALAAAITSMTSSRTGTLVDFQQVEFRIKDDGTARAITWGADFASGMATLPTTTVLGKTLHVYCEFDTVTGDLMCMATGSYP